MTGSLGVSPLPQRSKPSSLTFGWSPGRERPKVRDGQRADCLSHMQRKKIKQGCPHLHDFLCTRSPDQLGCPDPTPSSSLRRASVRVSISSTKMERRCGPALGPRMISVTAQHLTLASASNFDTGIMMPALLMYPAE